MPVQSLAGQIEVASDPHSLAQRVAEWFTKAVSALPGQVRIALSGGSTPRELYHLLATPPFRGEIPWTRLELFWGDERFVPRDDAASNARMVRETLLSQVPIAETRIHPMPVDGTPADAARRYEDLLKRIYGADRLDPARPLFDIMFLGLGSDGHTASLLPGQPVLEERERWVAAVTKGRSEARITLTYPAIEASATIAFLVTGADKTEAVSAVRAGDTNLPAGRIRAQGQIIWFLDRAAAGPA